MYVANYVPEPEAMPGNVTLERYALRLGFIRAVYWRFLAVTAAIGGIALLIPKGDVADFRFLEAWLITIGSVSLVRTIGRGKAWEVQLAPLLMIVTLLSTAIASRAATAVHFPAWAILAGIGVFGLYAAWCGRDFSFVGGYVLSLIVSSVIIAAVMVEERMSGAQGVQALCWNGFGLFYVVYDLAALMSRRKLGEENASVVDLYRDIFNVCGWLPRLLMHWERHRILNDLSFDLPFRRSEEE